MTLATIFATAGITQIPLKMPHLRWMLFLGIFTVIIHLFSFLPFFGFGKSSNNAETAKLAEQIPHETRLVNSLLSGTLLAKLILFLIGGTICIAYYSGLSYRLEKAERLRIVVKYLFRFISCTSSGIRSLLRLLLLLLLT